MKRGAVKILSFIGGLVFASAIAVVVVLKNEKLRNELETQASKIVETGKSAVEQVQFVVGKVSSIKDGLQNDKSNSKLLPEGDAPKLDSYDALWVDAETSAKAYQNANE